MRSAAFAVLLLLPGAAAAAAGSVYTEIDLEACPQGEDFGEAPAYEVICPGPPGWEVRVVEGDLRFHAEPRPAGMQTELSFQTLAPFNTIHATAEWRGETVAGTFEPYAFILRYFTDGGSGDEADNGNVLVVSKVAREGSCHVAYVDAAQHADANALARQAADTMARGFECAAHTPVTVSPGQPPLP